MKDFYTLKEALEIIEGNIPFSLKYVTFDEKRPDNCGEIKEIPECLLLVRSNEKFLNRGKTRLEKLVSDNELADTEGGVKRTAKVDKTKFFVRDVQPLEGGIPFGHPTRIHPKLVLFINNIKVMP